METTRLAPAVIVHSLVDVEAVLAQRRPVTLLSAPGAAVYAGCLWWRALVVHGRAAYPDWTSPDLLDCADASGHALQALRAGLQGLVLARGAPGWDRIAAAAAEYGALVLPTPPDALDMAGIPAAGRASIDALGEAPDGKARRPLRRLCDWLDAGHDPGDRGGPVG